MRCFRSLQTYCYREQVDASTERKIVARGHLSGAAAVVTAECRVPTGTPCPGLAGGTPAAWLSPGRIRPSPKLPDEASPALLSGCGRRGRRGGGLRRRPARQPATG